VRTPLTSHVSVPIIKLQVAPFFRVKLRAKQRPRPPLRMHPPLPLHHTLMHSYTVLILLILYYTKCKLLLCGSKLILNKKLQTTKFHNFLRSTTFILLVAPFKVIYKF
jgi:hypothetical protein